MNLYDELVGVVQALEATGVDYALVGGLAVSVWGAPRATRDIDLLVRPEDVAGATEAVHGCGYEPQAPTRFSDGMEMLRVSKIVSGQVMTLDFLLVDANLEPAWRSRERHELENASVRVIGRQALIAMKLAAGRAIDQHDAIKLTEQDR